MPSKGLVTLLMVIGSLIGGYIPALWGADFLSFSSILTSAIGGLLGIWIAVKISQL